MSFIKAWKYLLPSKETEFILMDGFQSNLFAIIIFQILSKFALLS